jgi:lysophospholipase L1-like esterase
MSDTDRPYTIICLGDSITKGERPGVEAGEIYEAVLERLLTQNGLRAKVIASGVGSEQTDGGLERFERDVVAQHPDCVTIKYGTNDGYVYEGEPAPRMPLDQYTANLRKLVGLAKAAGIQAVLMSPIPMSATGDWMAWSPYREDGPNCRLCDYVDAVAKVAAEEDVPLVDNFSVWLAHTTDTNRTMDDITTDGCHPNPEGHELIAETMLPVLMRLID